MSLPSANIHIYPSQPDSPVINMFPTDCSGSQCAKCGTNISFCSSAHSPVSPIEAFQLTSGEEGEKKMRLHLKKPFTATTRSVHVHRREHWLARQSANFLCFVLGAALSWIVDVDAGLFMQWLRLTGNNEQSMQTDVCLSLGQSWAERSALESNNGDLILGRGVSGVRGFAVFMIRNCMCTHIFLSIVFHL